MARRDKDMLAQLRRGQNQGLPGGALKGIVSRLVAAAWAVDFAGLWAIVEAASGIPRLRIAPLLGVSNRTLTRWASGRTIPLGPDFERLLPGVTEFSGLPESLWREAWQRSWARQAHPDLPAVPRPEWAREFAGAGLPLRFYLSRLRHEQRLTLSETGRKAGVTREAYRRWEEGLASPRVWQITRVWKHLAAPLGVTLAELEAARDEAAHNASAEVRRRKRLEAKVLAEQRVDPQDLVAMAVQQMTAKAGLAPERVSESDTALCHGEAPHLSVPPRDVSAGSKSAEGGVDHDD